MKHKHFRVSDHALMRYVERILGVSLDHVRSEIETKVKAFAVAGARKVTVGQAVFCVTEDECELVVATVMLTGDQNIPRYKPPASRQESKEHRQWANRRAARGQSLAK